jgi:WD40 repeat protein
MIRFNEAAVLRGHKRPVRNLSHYRKHKQSNKHKDKNDFINLSCMIELLRMVLFCFVLFCFALFCFVIAWNDLSHPAIYLVLTQVVRCAFHPNKPHLASCGEDGTVLVWHVDSHTILAEIPAHSALVSNSDFHQRLFIKIK